MRSTIIIAAVAVLAIAGGAYWMLGGGGKEPRAVPVPLDQVPAGFLKKAQEQLPEVKFDHARKTPKGNYELRGKGPNGKVREVEFNPAGDIVEIE